MTFEANNSRRLTLICFVTPSTIFVSLFIFSFSLPCNYSDFLFLFIIFNLQSNSLLACGHYFLHCHYVSNANNNKNKYFCRNILALQFMKFPSVNKQSTKISSKKKVNICGRLTATTIVRICK